MLLKKSQIAAVVTGLVVCAGMGITAKNAFADTTPTTAPTSQPTVAKEKHPDLRMALRQLKRAEMSLKNGAHDFQGERVEALKDTDKAIAEVEQALKSDRH